MSRKQNKETLFQKKRFKYGSVAIILTVVTVAAIVAFNVIFTSLAQTYGWFIDMTKSQVYTLRDAAREILDTLEDNTRIEFIFCSPLDKLDENIYQKQVLTLAQNIQREYDFVEIKAIDIITHPSEGRKYQTTEASTIKTTDVIITNGSDYRVHSIESFYTFAESDNSVFGFNGEYKVISAILQLQGNELIAYFTTNHSETVQKSSLWTLFEEAGFDVRTIDLTKEDIDSKAKIVIVNGPKYDFWGADDPVNEIKKVDDFVDRYGSLMIFMDPGASSMPELTEYLSEWGVSFEPALIRDYSSAMSTDGTVLVAQYATSGLGSSLHTTLRENLETPPITLSNTTRPVNILWTDYSGRNVTPILTTTANAETLPTSADGESQKGVFNLLTISAEMRYVNNEPMYTYVVAGGTSKFGDPAYLSNGGYGNQDILYSIMKALGKEKVPVSLEFKVYEDTSLSLTTAQSTRWTLVFTLIIPAIVSAAGIAVWLRRRHL
jgi:hypothetical protein